jgi:hypothetical protein
MADKLKKSIPVRFRFVDGEVPTGAKLNTLVSSLERSLFLLEKAIGDLDDQSYPYFASADTLTPAAARAKDDGNAIGSDRKLEQVNLARLLGPASALNPIHQFGTTNADDVIVQTIPSSGNSFRFKYHPNFYGTMPAYTGTGAVFTTLVSSANLNAAGEYCYENDEVITFSTMAGGTVSYYAETAGGDDPDTVFADPLGSTYNVIPDPNQATKCTCAGPTDSKYTITLPLITHAVTDDMNITSTLSDDDLSYNVRLKLPSVLSNMVAGDEIPEGFLYLRDDSTGKIYTDATYYYFSGYEFKVGGVTLDNSHSYTVLTVGSNVTETLLDLKTKVWRMRRGGDSLALFHTDQLNKRMGIGTGELYVPSDVGFNYFPQYLHRDGWFATDDNNNINDQNGMRGDLVLLSTIRASGTRNHTSSDSQKIRFGSATTGASVGYIASPYAVVSFVAGDATGFHFDEPVICRDGFSIDNTVSTGPLKWYIYEGVFTANVSGDYSLSIPAVLTGKTLLSMTSMIFLTAFPNIEFPSNYNATMGYYVYIDRTTGFLYFQGESGWASQSVTYKIVIQYRD